MWQEIRRMKVLELWPTCMKCDPDIIKYCQELKKISEYLHCPKGHGIDRDDDRKKIVVSRIKCQLCVWYDEKKQNQANEKRQK